MARYYQMFETQEEQKAWEKERKAQDEKFRVCMRMAAQQLKKDLPFVDVGGSKYVTIWTN